MPATLRAEDARRIIQSLTPEEQHALLAELGRDAVKDKSYELLPLGQHVAVFLRAKGRAGSELTVLAYESTLNRFVWNFRDLDLGDFEGPVGTERIEEWLDHEWGRKKAATFNRHHAAISSFFEFYVRRGRLLVNPVKDVRKARKRDFYRETFADDQSRAIIAAADELRDRIALRLLLHYGLRRGGLQAVQFKHFDHVRKRLTVFLKGGKVRHVPLPDPAFWHDLERHILDVEAKPGHYLMHARRKNRYATTEQREKPMSVHGLHKWWYRCLAAAGVVESGVTAGERMHKARHTAGQRVLDKTGGNLKAAQKLLGHASIQTTGDIYTDWDDAALALTMAEVLRDEDGA